MDIFERSLEAHRVHRGKLEIATRVPLDSAEALSLAYTPGVARPCEVIAQDPAQAWDLTWKGRTVAVVSDGSAVLGLGDLGPLASLPVMEGKAALFREFAGIDAVPIVIDAREPDEIVRTVEAIAPGFGGINLEDISAPRCFEVERRLQNLGIPVLHDDQHGTAIVLLAALLNATRVLGRELDGLRIVINGAGAAGHAIANLLPELCGSALRVRMCDSRGVLWPGRPENDPIKESLAQRTNPEGESGDLRAALVGADVFVGVSRGNLLDAEAIRSMAPEPIVFAMANPTPEIDPEIARAAGAKVVGTGRSDFPNQINNVLAFPGLFRGALEARVSRFTPAMKLAAVHAIAGYVATPTPEMILPAAFDPSVAVAVADAVFDVARSGHEERDDV